MPRKTRKEKMSAQLRRLKSQVEGEQPDFKLEKPVTKKVVSVPAYEPELNVSNPVQIRSDQTNYSYVISDLSKIGLLIIVTLILEVALNLTVRTNFAKLLLSNLGIEL